MRRVYLVRHGQTNYNEEGLVQDDSSVLTDLGKKQAALIGNRLSKIEFEHLVASDYIRAQETAKIVEGIVEKKATFNPLFREVRRPSRLFHTLHTGSDYKEFLKSEIASFEVDEDWRDSDEENFMDVQKRVTEAFKFLNTLQGDVAIITHGHFIRKLVATVATNFNLTAPIWKNMYSALWTTNTGLTVLQQNEENGHWKIVTFNDHAHFADN